MQKLRAFSKRDSSRISRATGPRVGLSSEAYHIFLISDPTYSETDLGDRGRGAGSAACGLRVALADAAFIKQRAHILLEDRYGEYLPVEAQETVDHDSPKPARVQLSGERTVMETA